MNKLMFSNLENIQVKSKLIGKSGCYFLSLIYGTVEYAESFLKRIINIDVIKFYDKCLGLKIIDSECTVLDAAKIVANILDFPESKVKARHEVLGYIPKFNEIEITRYELAELGVTYAHFVVTRDNKVIYDPYANSRTYAKGEPKSKRIITIL